MSDKLLVGSLLPGATEIHNQNVNRVWRGHMVTNDGKVEIYAKMVIERVLVVEVFCALVGRALGLPMPRPALVQVLPGTIPDLPHQDGRPYIFFGSEGIDAPDFRQQINASNEQELLDKLAQWRLALPTGCFDEWVANDDRHGGNILYNGEDDFFLIDHSHAIPAGTAPHQAANKNTLLSHVSAAHDNANKTYSEASSCMRIYPDTYRNLCAEALTLVSKISSEQTINEIANFLLMRIKSMNKLIADRVGCSQLSLELENDNLS